MTPSKILRLLLAIAVTALFVLSINFVQGEMNKIRREKALTDDDPVKNAPPIVAFTTVVLGSFRGLIADVLWLRAAILQEKGQYFEMYQIASLITKLQPRFTGATAYLAWNMAYNISVVFSSPVDRWRWVKKGLELIRDEAIVYNPADPILYKELGWIYQHKIGNIMDDANFYYKQQMALDYMKVFGGKEPKWKQLIGAPDDLETLKKIIGDKNPFWQELAKAGYESLEALEKQFRTEGELPEAVRKIGGANASLDTIDACLRKKWLVEVYKLDPRKMLSLNERYGAFDWRLPEAHALYWATLGLEKSKLSEREIGNDRMITQALKDAFIGGRLLMVDKDEKMNFMTVPNLNLTDSVISSLKEAYALHKSSSFRTGSMKNFMVDAMVLLYTFGKYKKASEVLEDMRKEFPEDQSLKRELDVIVDKELKEDIKDASTKQAMDIVASYIFRTCYFLAYGEFDEAESHEKMAQKIYESYRKEKGDSWERTGMPPFAKLKAQITEACIKNFPPLMSEALAMELQNLNERQKTNTSDK